jgi:hypothetical protein
MSISLRSGHLFDTLCLVTRECCVDIIDDICGECVKHQTADNGTNVDNITLHRIRLHLGDIIDDV